MHLQYPQIILLIAAGTTLTIASPTKEESLQLPKHDDEKPTPTGFVTIQTSPPTSTSTSSTLYAIHTSPSTPISSAIAKRAIKDWYDDSHRKLNKFGRFVFRVTQFGKKIFLYLTSTIEHVHDPDDEMIDLSTLSPEELDALISGTNITAIVDESTNTTIHSNGTVTSDLNTTTTFLRRRALSRTPKTTKQILHYTDTPLPSTSPKRPTNPTVAAWQKAWRNIGYDIKKLFVTEMVDERPQREKLRTGQMSQQEFDHWLQMARTKPEKYLADPVTDESVVNEAYTKWAFKKKFYWSRPWEFNDQDRNGDANPEYIAYDMQVAKRLQRPARYLFNGTRNPLYEGWQKAEMRRVGDMEKFLTDETCNPAYVARLVSSNMTVRPTESLKMGKVNPDFVAWEILEAKKSGRPSRWTVEGVPNDAYFTWDKERMEREYERWSKRQLVVPDFNEESETAEDDWEAWKAMIRAKKAGKQHGKRQLVVPDFNEDSETAEDDWEAWKAMIRAKKAGKQHGKRQLVVPDFNEESEDGEDEWEAWKAMIRAKKNQYNKRQLDGPDFNEDSETAEEDWEAWKARVRAGSAKRGLVVPDFEEESETAKEDWEAWKARVRAGRGGGKRDVDVDVPVEG